MVVSTRGAVTFGIERHDAAERRVRFPAATGNDDNLARPARRDGVDRRLDRARAERGARRPDQLGARLGRPDRRRHGAVAAEGFPMGGMEFQVVLLFMALYFLVMGNAGNSR